MQTNILQAALAYAERGYSVIPIRPDKKPYVPWTEYQKRRATPEEIRKWFGKWPGAMIGIVTGQVSGIFVIDCDTAEAYQKIQELLPDALVLPIARTPRGGWHLYFIFPAGKGLTIGAGIIQGLDFRGKGGYIIAPPSINDEGKAYAWMPGCSIHEVAPAPMPSGLSTFLHLNKRSTLYRGCKENVRSAPLDFSEGCRDESLFCVANALVKGGMSKEVAEQVLGILADSCVPPFPQAEARAKVASALKRTEGRERPLAEDVRRWLTLQDTYIHLTDAYKDLQILTSAEKENLYVIFNRLRKQGIIEKYGDRPGAYRIVNQSCEPIDIAGATDEMFPLALPFGIERLVKVMPRNIVVVAGEPNAGKTAYLLNLARLNQGDFDCHYFSSEMGAAELRARLEKFDLPMPDWKVRFWERSSGFADVIRPDGINIIDFLEVSKDFYLVGQYIREIFDKLRKGIAVIALQKPRGRDEGLGGQRGLEKPRLYVSLEPGRAKIVKAKNWATATNPNGLCLDFKLVSGCKFIPTRQWYRNGGDA